jgi:hypothetical protein
VDHPYYLCRLPRTLSHRIEGNPTPCWIAEKRSSSLSGPSEKKTYSSIKALGVLFQKTKGMIEDAIQPLSQDKGACLNNHILSFIPKESTCEIERLRTEMYGAATSYHDNLKKFLKSIEAIKDEKVRVKKVWEWRNGETQLWRKQLLGGISSLDTRVLRCAVLYEQSNEVANQKSKGAHQSAVRQNTPSINML